MHTATPRLLGAALSTLMLLASTGCASLHGGPGCAPEGGPPGDRHADRRGPPPPPHGPPPDPAFIKAFDSCVAEQRQQQGGQAATAAPSATPAPMDREAMDACLRGKGIQPPAAPPHD